MSQRSLARPINAPDIFEIGFWTVPESAFTFITSTTRTKKHEICSPLHLYRHHFSHSDGYSFSRPTFDTKFR